MKKRMCRYLFVVIFAFILNGCASSTTIKTLPDGVKVSAGAGNLLGVTPYYYWDRNFSWESVVLVLEKEGYKSQQVTIKKDCYIRHGLVIQRFVTRPVFVGPWTLGYQPEYLFEMEKLTVSK
jgi:hypothetical protein